MKNFAWLLFILLCHVSLCSLADTPDQWVRMLASEIPDSARARYLHALTFHYRHIETEKAMNYGLKALEISERGDLEPQKAESLRLLATLYRLQDDYLQALNFANQSLELLEALDDQPGKGQALIDKARIYTDMGMYPEALETNLNAINILEQVEGNASLPELYNSMGEIYRLQEDFSMAMDYYDKAIHLAEAQGNQDMVAGVLNNSSLVYREQDKLDLALEHLFRALNIAHSENNKRGISTICNNIGLMYKRKDDYGKSLQYYMRALKVKNELNDRAGRAYSLNDIGELYGMMGKFELAEQYSLEALQVAREINAPYLIKDISLTLAHIFQQQGKFDRAYSYQSDYISYKDSLFSEDKSREIGRLEKNMELNRKELEYELLKTEKELAEENSQRQNLITLIVVGGALLLLGLAIVIFRSFSIVRKAHDELNEKNQELAEMNHQQKHLMAAVAHDLNAPLNKVLSLVDLLEHSGPLNSDQAESTVMVRQVVNNGLAFIQQLLEMEHLEHSDTVLRPETFDLHELLGATVNEFSEQAAKKELALECQGCSTTMVLYAEKDAIIRILENLISNAIKFSPRDKSIEVNTRQDGDTIQLMVRDEGPGIRDEDRPKLFKKFQKLSAQPTGGEPSTGLGLSITHALVQRLQGHIHVASEPGKGATFIVTLPYRTGPDHPSA